MWKYKSKRLFIIHLAICCLLFCSFLLILYGGILLKLQRRALQIDNGFVFLTLQHESNPTEMPFTEKSINDFNELYREFISEEQLYTYYEIYTQPLLIEGQECDCAQISSNVLNDFSVKVEGGRTFCETDFLAKENKAIPILAGNDLKDKYNLGDVFQANYLYENYSFEVIGYLQPETQIRRSSGTIFLDSYLVMPSLFFDYQPQTETQYVSQLIHGANKVSGKIRVLPQDLGKAKEVVQEFIESAGVGEFSYYSSIFPISPIYIILISVLSFALFLILEIKVIMLISKRGKKGFAFFTILTIACGSGYIFSVFTEIRVGLFWVPELILCGLLCGFTFRPKGSIL